MPNNIFSAGCLYATGENRYYHCYINKKLGLYKCISDSKDYDFIKLDPDNGSEHFVIEIDSNYAGIYQFDLILEYAIGIEKNNLSIIKKENLVIPSTAE
jgi:hypothetical protein